MLAHFAYFDPVTECDRQKIYMCISKNMSAT